VVGVESPKKGSERIQYQKARSAHGQFLARIRSTKHPKAKDDSGQASCAVKGNSPAAAGLYAQNSELLLQFLQGALLRRPSGLIEPAGVRNPDSERGLLLEIQLGVENNCRGLGNHFYRAAIAVRDRIASANRDSA